MCGIFITINNEDADKNQLIKHRGPDNTHSFCNDNVNIFFHRLAIVDISDASNQPIEMNEYVLVCNGEIYNHNALERKYNIQTKSHSDCEIILHMFLKFGIERTCKELDGVFAFVIYSIKSRQFFIGRDPFGVRPLFVENSLNGISCISSELKGISSSNVIAFPPGHYYENGNYISYYSVPIEKLAPSYDIILNKIRNLLMESVYKRLMSDRPIGCLLSGGLDSSLVASILVNLTGKKIDTYSIGIEGFNSTDLSFANLMAGYINSKHHEVKYPIQTWINTIDNVIYTCETYDVTTIRASCGMYLLSKYIKENSNNVVIFSGEGADEVFQGYKYFKNAPTASEANNESRRLINQLYKYDVLRADRTTSCFGLELRVPFLDKDLVDYYMSVVSDLKQNEIEKYLLRQAFNNDDRLLPNEILFRAKEAFSDGVSCPDKSWHSYLKKYFDSKITDEEYEKMSVLYTPKPISKEALYYRAVFEKKFNNQSHVIGEYWMPKWTNVNDPSARDF